MFSVTDRTSTQVRSALVSAIALFASTHASSQQTGGFYKERFERVRSITQSMVNGLANATLDSACLTAANFERATASLDAESKATAARMREAGIRTLNETKAWKTCKSQREQIAKLAADMSSAAAWRSARSDAKRSASLADNEEIENGILVDHKTKKPITSAARLAFPLSSDALLGSRYGARGSFDAILTVSEDGLVTACNISSSIGNEFADGVICRKAQSLMRYRPAFANGNMVASTTRLRVSVTD